MLSRNGPAVFSLVITIGLQRPEVHELCFARIAARLVSSQETCSIAPVTNAEPVAMLNFR